MDPRALEHALEQARRERGAELHSFLVAVEGRLVYEWYSEPSERERARDLRSATKSIKSILLAMAIEQGHLTLSDSVAQWFPELDLAAHWSEIRVEHLLTMSSGIDCDDHQPQTHRNEDAMYETRNWLAYVFASPPQREPGSEFRYCTGGIVVLGEILARALGRPVPEYADAMLFAPLGIASAQWESTPRGRTDTGGHLRLTPRDLLKVGLLVAGGGAWQGRTLVSSEALSGMVEPKMVIPQPDGSAQGYGALWYVSRVPESLGPHESHDRPAVYWAPRQRWPVPRVDSASLARRGDDRECIQSAPARTGPFGTVERGISAIVEAITLRPQRAGRVWRGGCRAMRSPRRSGCRWGPRLGVEQCPSGAVVGAPWRCGGARVSWGLHTRKWAGEGLAKSRGAQKF